MSNDSNKEYSVNWKNHMSHVRKAFDHLLNTNELTDVTLYCEGKKIGAHKMLLSACSAYFRDTFKEVPCQHPVIVMYGVEYNVLSDILHFIYRGEVSVDNSKLDTFLKTAQLLQISGLSDDPSERLISENDQTTEVLNSNEREDSYNIQSPIQASSVSDEHKSTTVGTKRLKSNEVVDAPREKVQRSGNDTVFISDVKCEPSELANFEDPLEDPLLQPDQTGETKEYVVAGGIHTEEEFKIERAGFFDKTAIVEFEQKSKHSNFSEDCLRCLQCNKMFSHPYSLHHHKAVHSGNTECPICHAVLSRKYNLKMHMKARHNI